MKNRRRIICLFCTALITLCLFPSSALAEENTPTIKVGYYEYGNYMSQNSDNEYIGFNIEYLQKIAKYANRDYEIVDCKSWERASEMLESGEIDIIPTVYKTSTCAQKFMFAALPMCSAYSTLNVRADDTRFQYEDFNVFDDMTVGVIRGSADADNFQAYCTQNNFSSNVVYYETTPELLDALKNGALDGIATSQLGRNSTFRSVAQFAPQPLYFACSGKSATLRDELDSAMNTIRLRDPYYEARLYDKYFSVSPLQSPVFTQEEREYISSAAPIRVAYNSNGMPLEYTDPHTHMFSGIAASMIASISKNSGLLFEYIPAANRVDASSLVKTGKADILSSAPDDYLWSDENNIDTTLYYLRAPLVSVSSCTPEQITRIALPEGYNLSERISASNPQMQITFYKTSAECISAIKNGYTDATYTNTYVANYFITAPEYENLLIAPLTDYSDDIGIGVSKNTDPRLFSILDKCVQYTSSEQINEMILTNSLSTQPITLQSLLYEYPTEAAVTLIMLFIIAISILLYIMLTRSKNNKRIYTLLYIDNMTGIRNLNKFRIDAAKILHSSNNVTHAVIYTDICQFKAINDAFGFKEGDELLCRIARFLENDMENDECCARVSADQFVMLLHYDNWEQLKERTDALTRQLNNYVKEMNKTYTVNIVFGVYIIPASEPTDLSMFIDFAQYAMKSGRINHKSDIILYDEQMRQEKLYQRHLSDIMEDALKRKEFVPYFQPKINMLTGTLVGGEALVRWIRPDGRMIYPGEFIPFFESNGFITEIDLSVFEQVCAFLRKQIDAGLSIKPISSNFSRLHFSNDQFARTLTKIANKYAIPHKYLEIEITENIVMGNVELVSKIFAELKKLGFLLSIDDFGTGYSSLGVLQRLSVDTIKLDRSFIMDNLHSKREQIIIRGIVSMANALNIHIICEGVETKEQADMLLSLGCSYAQGFYYAKPMCVSDFEKLF